MLVNDIYLKTNNPNYMSEIVAIGLLLVSLIIIIGFLSNYQFTRTGIPGILFLILLGFLFGPIFNIVKTEDIAGYAPYLADLAMILILFEAGLAMNLQKTFQETPRAVMITLLNLFFGTAAVIVFFMSIEISPLYGALFGIMISGNSATVLIPIIRSIKIKEEVKTAITLESTLNNVFQVVSFLALIGIVASGSLDVFEIAQDIAARFCVGGVIGFMFGLFWVKILSKIKREAYASMLTIAVLFVSYYISEYLGGNGALSALLFGLVLGNERLFYRIINVDTESAALDEYMVHFESDVAFLVRTFFFVYIGVTINVSNPLWILYGAILSGLLLVMRILVIYITTIRSSLQSERSLLSVVLARGLNETVLSVIFLSYNLPYSDMFQQIAFIIIIITNLLTTIGVYRFTRLKRKTQNDVNS